MNHAKSNMVNHCWTNVIPNEIPEFAKTEFDDHHEPLQQRQKYAFLRGTCPHLLKAVSGAARDTDRAPLGLIELATTSEEQYQLLRQFYVCRGLISRTAMKDSMNQEELVHAFNLKNVGKGNREIARILGRSPSTVWRALKPKDEPTIKQHRLTKRQKEYLITLYKTGISPKEIATKTMIPARTVRSIVHSQKEFRLVKRG